MPDPGMADKVALFMDATGQDAEQAGGRQFEMGGVQRATAQARQWLDSSSGDVEQASRFAPVGQCFSPEIPPQELLLFLLQMSLDFRHSAQLPARVLLIREAL